MSDFDPLPPVPNLQLQEPQLTVPGFQRPSASFGLPQLQLDPSLAAGLDPGSGATGGGAQPDLNLALDYMTDPLHAAVPAAPPPAPLITGGGFVRDQLGGALNPWYANPQGTAEDVQRQLNTVPQIDPGVAAQQTIIHSPTFRF